VDWARSIQLLPAQFGNHYENGVLVGTSPLNECSFLHSRELVREAALVPVHHPGQGLLAEFTFAKTGEARQHSKFRAGKSGCRRNVTPDAAQYVFAHKPEGMPYTQLAGGQQFAGHD
jgi:hypothetical protein